MTHSRTASFEQVAASLGHSFDGEMRIGGNYVPVIENDGEVYVSGQVPRIGDTVVVTGKVGADTSLEEGKRAARICAMRALAILRQTLGSLDRVKRILRITVYVQSAPDFTQQSEVADAASEVLYSVFDKAGIHTRTSVGVYQLPKNAAVELDMIVAVEPAPPPLERPQMLTGPNKLSGPVPVRRGACLYSRRLCATPGAVIFLFPAIGIRFPAFSRPARSPG